MDHDSHDESILPRRSMYIKSIQEWMSGSPISFNCPPCSYFIDLPTRKRLTGVKSLIACILFSKNIQKTRTTRNTYFSRRAPWLFFYSEINQNHVSLINVVWTKRKLVERRWLFWGMICIEILIENNCEENVLFADTLYYYYVNNLEGLYRSLSKIRKILIFNLMFT